MTKPILSPDFGRRLAALERLVPQLKTSPVSAGVGISFDPNGRAILPGGVLVGPAGITAAGSAPPAPTGLVLTPGAGDGDVWVEVDWTPAALSAAGPITAWTVEVLLDGDTLPMVFHPPLSAAPPFRATGLQPNSLYHFTVRAITQLGASSAGLTGDATTAYDTSAPSAVTGLVAYAGYVTITATWDALGTTLAPFTGKYIVQRADDAGFTTGLVEYDNGNSNIITITGLTTGASYYVRVRPRSAAGVDAATWTTVGPTSPGAVTGSTTTDGSAPAASPSTITIRGGVGFILVSWLSVANVDPLSYEVHIGGSSGFTPSSTTLVAEVAQVDQNAGSTVFAFVKQSNASGSALVYGTTYFFTVIAKDADGASVGALTYASGSMVKATGGVTGDIDANTITAANIAAATITANEIAANTITAAKIAANTVTAAQIAAGTITATQIASGTITASQIATNTITAASGIIASIDASKITTNQMDVARLGAGTIGAYLIQLASGGTIRSANYVSGTSGWSIDGAGNAEHNNITIRGIIAAATFASTDFSFYDSGAVRMLRIMRSGNNHWLQLGAGISSNAGIYWDATSNHYVFEAGSANSPSWNFTGNVKMSGTLFADGSISAGGGWLTGGFFANNGSGVMDSNWGVGFQNGNPNFYTRVVYYGDGVNDRRAGFVNNRTGAWVAYADTNSAWTVPSSRKIKKNIAPVAWDALGILGKLRVVEFELKADDSGYKHHGMVAEDVAAVMPEMVSFDADGKPAGIITEARSALLVAAVQQLASRVTALEGAKK